MTTAAAALDAASFLEAHELTKVYPGTLALDQVSLRLRRGEIRGLIGENGAGKSTLVRILSGALRPTSGGLVVDGRKRAFRSPRDALDAGIATIYQDLTVVPQLTVAENIMLGREPAISVLGGTRSRRRGYALASEALARVGARLDPRQRVAELTYSERQLVDIAKALSTNCGLLILDEPTAALSQDDSDLLLRLLRRLSSDGHAILYVSHRLDEILGLTETVSVVRDGRHIATVETKDASRNGLIGLMVGGIAVASSAGQPAADAVLEVASAGRPPFFDEVTFSVRSGEILGLAGVRGSGTGELLEALAGATRLSQGRVAIDGTRIELRSTSRALREGIAYVPSDRKARGLALGLSARFNIVLPPNGHAATHGWRRRRRERAVAQELMARTQVRPLAPELRVDALSGGNQQKVLIARLLYAAPKVVLIDEPTQGVDVAGREQIHALLRAMAAQGVAVVIASSEVEELQSLCHRIVALRMGRVSGRLETNDSKPEEVLRLILPE